jgi:4-amino-4-deoxy-L-arabinose transferase-like glycosyltransferase
LQSTTLTKRTWLVFFIAVVAFYFYGLNAIPFVGPDEPRYAQVAREMFERGAWVTPTLGGYTWFEKPALLYWFEIVFYNLFGISEIAARAGSALSGAITALALYALGQRVEYAMRSEREDSIENRKANKRSATGSRQFSSTALGRWSSLVFATSIGAITFSRAASFDIILTMPVAVSLACFFLFDIETDEKKRRWYLIGFYAFMGVSLLAKGLVGIVIPGGVVFWYFVIQRRRPAKSELFGLLWGVPLCLLVAAAWYAPVIIQNGYKFVDEFFIQHHFARYTSNKYLHPQPFYFFFVIAPLLALPWTPFLVQAMWKTKDWNWRKIESVSDRFQLFALIWFAFPILFFSLSGSKLPGYVLPTLPAAALLVGQRVAAYVRETDDAKAMRASGILLLVLSITGAVYVLRKTNVSSVYIMLVFIPLCIAGGFAIAGVAKRNVYALSIIAAILLSCVVTLNCIAPFFAGRDSARDLIAEANARGLANAPVLNLHTVEHSAEFYATGRLWRDDEGKQKKFERIADVAAISRRRRDVVLVLIPLRYMDQLKETKEVQSETIADNGDIAIVALRAR